ncbi:histidine phosphatase family protein [Pseudomonas sp. NFACC13-1]|uniref:histidine phosphatase family protein n=1 Tax=Pseudomonas sp. NFACC13-1 TaxID=1566245 RepID=UPI000885EC5E|nr:histidine phosphatase family protein [Pseudomonas sp. NFACC13-1]SDB34955.1 Broad specificity phosphatase PhoE [Pseudomonas sp. NFACC13-1]
MSSLYLLRHGQACFDSEDYDRLSPLGLRQAFVTGSSLAMREMHFDQVLVGPRRRHLQTADAVLASMSGSTVMSRVEALDEFADGGALLCAAQSRVSADHWPADMRGRMHLYHEEIRRWASGVEDIPGCMPITPFRAGLAEWLSALTCQVDSGSRLLAVTSAGVIAALVSNVLDLPSRRILDLLAVLDNAALSELVFRPGHVSLRFFNSTHHLPVALTSRI